MERRETEVEGQTQGREKKRAKDNRDEEPPPASLLWKQLRPAGETTTPRRGSAADTATEQDEEFPAVPLENYNKKYDYLFFFSFLNLLLLILFLHRAMRPRTGRQGGALIPRPAAPPPPAAVGSLRAHEVVRDYTLERHRVFAVSLFSPSGRDSSLLS